MPLLGKPGRLTEAEYEVIRTHPRVGSRMLAGHHLASLVDAAVLMHHETPNGKGYPLGLAGNDIPIDARIIGVCNAFDAMTSLRPYRKGMPHDRATNATWRSMPHNVPANAPPACGRSLLSRLLDLAS